MGKKKTTTTTTKHDDKQEKLRDLLESKIYSDYLSICLYHSCISLSIFSHIFVETYYVQGASPVAQMVKSLFAMQETLVRSLGWDNSLQYSCLEKPTVRKAWQATVHECMGPQNVKHG